MAGTNLGARYNGKVWPSLDPDQQRLLFNALTSNRNKQANRSSPDKSSKPNLAAPNQASPSQTGSGAIDPSVFRETSQHSGSVPSKSLSMQDKELPVDFDVGGSNFDLGLDTNDTNTLSEDYFAFNPADFEGEGGEKRKNPVDEEDSDDDVGDTKRRESEDNPAKKPGRKPLTSEPTTKRKAQNRAAQRAFRERKEKHVKDLELKVMDLEKASESANHENGVLRAQVDRLQDELKDYRRRMSLNNNPSPPRGHSLDSFFGGGMASFDFDFTKFGTGNEPQSGMSGGNQTSNDMNGPSMQSPLSLTESPGNENTSLKHSSSSTLNSRSASIGKDQTSVRQNSSAQQVGNGIFGNGFFEGMASSNFGSNSSVPAVFSPAHSYGGSSQSHASPAGSGSGASTFSSNAIKGPTSSCRTSPDPIDNWLNYEDKSKNQSNESNSAPGSTPGLSSGKTPNSEIASFDWLASQNGGQFDPVLFGDYRDNQEAVVGNDLFSSGFFEESLGLPDMNDPFNFNLSTDKTIPARVPDTLKPGLMDQVEKQRDGGVEPKVMPAPNLMTCHKIWNQLQDCPNFKSGDFDVDSLCAELSSKAKCTETGVAVPKDAVEAALWKLSGSGEGTAGAH